MGKCHGLLQGTGPGCQVCTLRKPIPVPQVDGFWLELKLRLKWHQRNTGLSHSLQSTPPPPKTDVYARFQHHWDVGVQGAPAIMYFNIIYWLQNRTNTTKRDLLFVMLHPPPSPPSLETRDGEGVSSVDISPPTPPCHVAASAPLHPPPSLETWDGGGVSSVDTLHPSLTRNYIIYIQCIFSSVMSHGLLWPA